MRIAFDYQAFCRQSAGGISRYFCRLADQLHARQETVGVFAPLYRNQYLAQVPCHLVHGIHLKSYPPRTAEALVTFNRWMSRGQVRNWHPDLVHETYFSPKSVAPVGCPVVITVFDMIPELEPEARDSASGKLRSAAKVAAVARADRVICISENTRQDLIRLFGTPPDKVSVAHLGCDSLPGADDETESRPGSERPFLPPLEAMTQGCPVICSDRSSIPEVVADAGEYFDPDEPQSIARMTEAVVYSSARTSALIAAGRRRAALFTWERCAQRHLDVYRSLVSA